MDQIPGLLPVFRGEASLKRMRFVPGLEACGVEGGRKRAGILGEGCAMQPGSQPGQRPACPGNAAPSGGSRSQVPWSGVSSKHLWVLDIKYMKGHLLLVPVFVRDPLAGEDPMSVHKLYV